MLAASFAVLVVLGLPLLAGRIYVQDDLGQFHLPLRYFYAEALGRGDSFFWCPDLLAGFYLHGEGQAGMLHPLHLLLYGLLPLQIGFGLELWICYPVMLAGTFLFLRRWGLGRGIALFGAFAFSFSGFNLLHHVHVNAIAIIAHLPWLLLCVDGVLRGRGRMSAGLGLALLTGSQLLLGYPQYVWFCGLVEIGYVVLLTREVGWRRVHKFVGLKALGVLIGAVQLLPTFEALAGSERADPTQAFRYSGSLHPLNLLQLWSPYLFESRVIGAETHEMAIYPGALGTLSLVWLLIHRKDPGRDRRVTWAILLLFAAGLVLALGEYGLLYRLQARLPLVGSFRNPCRYALLAYLAAALATALMMGELYQLRRPFSWRRLLPLSLIPLVSIVTALCGLLRLGRDEGVLAPAFNIAAGPLIFVVIGGLLVAACRKRTGALLTLAMVGAIDIAVYGLSYVLRLPPTTIAEFAEREPPPPVTSTQLGPARLEYPNNVLLLKGYKLADAYLALYPRWELGYQQIGRMRLAGVQWWRIRPGTSPRLDDLLGRGVYWLEVKDPLPRTRLVSRAVISSKPRSEIASLPLETTALVGEDLELSGSAPGRAVLVSDRPGNIMVDTDAPGRQLLVVSETYHPGWRVLMDGRPKRALRVNGDFLGCVVEAGRHSVEFRFSPWSLRWGTGITVIACVALAGVGIAGRSRRAE